MSSIKVFNYTYFIIINLYLPRKIPPGNSNFFFSKPQVEFPLKAFIFKQRTYFPLSVRRGKGAAENREKVSRTLLSHLTIDGFISCPHANLKILGHIFSFILNQGAKQNLRILCQSVKAHVSCRFWENQNFIRSQGTVSLSLPCSQ